VTPAARRRRLIGGAAGLVLAVAVAVVLVTTGGGGATPRTAELTASRVVHRSAAPQSAANVRPVTNARHPATGARSSAATYGGLPSWLPKAKVAVGRILHASAGHPVLAIQGDAVAVRLRSGRATVTTVGPVVPEEGRFPVPATSPCRFEVSFAAGRGAVPLRSAAFTILDELGHLHRPRITLRGGGPVPAQLAPGQIVTLTVSAVLPTGGGRLRWAPEGSRPLVAWDFDVEID
jgi:hypothetical protein